MEKLVNQTGYLILKEDGAVLESGGEMENDEKSANVIMELIHLTDSVDDNFISLSSCERVNLVYEEHTYSICLSNKKIYVVKIKNPSEGVTTANGTTGFLESDAKVSNILT